VLRGRWIELIAPLAILVGAIALKTLDTQPLQQLRHWVFDAFQRFEPRAYPEDAPVRVVDIDDASLERLGQWPWPRTRVAQMIDRLNAMGAAVIAFDVVFAEADRTSPAQILPLWRDHLDPAVTAPLLETLPDHDAVMAEAVAAAPVVTGFIMVEEPSARLPAIKAGFATAGDDPRPFIAPYAGAVVNIPVIEAAAHGNGHFNQTPEVDGIVRRVPLMLRVGDKIYPSLASEALRVAQEARGYIIRASGASGETAFGRATGVNSIRIGSFAIPTDPNARAWIRYTASTPARYVPAWRVLEDDAVAPRIEGNIVFVGTSALGLRDIRSIPLNPTAPGVEIHANFVEQVLTGAFLDRPDWIEGAEILGMVAMALLLTLLLPRWGAVWCAVLGLGAVGAAGAVAWVAFSHAGLLVDPVTPSLMALAVYLSASLSIYIRSETDRRRVRTAFSRYMSPTMVDQLAEHPEQLRLGGESRTMTIMFCDIRRFTRLSEQYDATTLTQILNRFLTPMTGIILETRGTIDKYMGDAIMAFWNAPLDDPEQAVHACQAAVRMAATLKTLNAQWRAEAEAAGRSFVPIRISIGVNTGRCLVGNLGSEQRFDYSVIGDDVNLASRLQGQSKQTYGVTILVGEATAAAAGDFALLEADLIKVKGKSRPVRVFALLGDPAEAAEPWFTAIAPAHARMIAAYRGRDWDGAMAALEACERHRGDRLDALYELYRARIEQNRAADPGPDWDGVYVARSK